MIEKKVLRRQKYKKLKYPGEHSKENNKEGNLFSSRWHELHNSKLSMCGGRIAEQKY